MLVKGATGVSQFCCWFNFGSMGASSDYLYISWCSVNTLRLRQNGRHFADDIFKCIFLNENVGIPIKILLKFVSKGPINNIPALVQIMVWRRPGDKPLSEPVMFSLLTHICVTRSQWVELTLSTCCIFHDVLINWNCLPVFFLSEGDTSTNSPPSFKIGISYSAHHY